MVVAVLMETVVGAPKGAVDQKAAQKAAVDPKVE
jgi:hypothetical protein